MGLKLWKTILSTALVSALTVSNVIPVLASNGDIYDKTNKVTYASADYNSNTAVYDQLIDQLTMGQGLNRFTYEFNNLQFNFDEYSDEVTRLIATNLSPTAAKTAAAAEPGLLNQVGSGTVTSVTAINGLNVPTGTTYLLWDFRQQ
jgi:NAD(P)-dependent dehydrogenase (short-subunit alcohol dehydrogenase family)